MIRALLGLGVVGAFGCGGLDSGPPCIIEGSARLPACTDAPVFDLDHTTWYDEGTVTITGAGCDLAPGTEVEACGLAWAATQAGQEVEITVDGEYTIFGRACGDQLHLHGGWWLAVENDLGACDYEDGTEVGIDAGGAALTVDGNQMAGTLAISEQCPARYEVTLHRAGG